MSWRLAVLGPVELALDAVPTAPLPPKQQAALVMLACAHGRTVSVDELVDGVWGPRPPASAVGALRNYVWSLRKHLSASDSLLLVSESRGYRLQGALTLDADGIDRLRVEAAQARAAGGFDRVELVLRRALSRWRGDPLTGVPGPWAAAERARLRRLHRMLVEDLVESTVLRGDFAYAITELEALIAADPHSERLRGLMMTALYRAGRRIEALDEFQRIRRLLVSGQGVEPGPMLLELQRQILADELPALGETLLAAEPVRPQLNTVDPAERWIEPLDEAEPFVPAEIDAPALTSAIRSLIALYRLAVAGAPHHRGVAADLALAVAEVVFADASTVDRDRVLAELARPIEFAVGAGRVAAARSGSGAACQLASTALFPLPDVAAAPVGAGDAGSEVHSG
ncbi:BTAD domain-containing putative transcriptional regulator [Nocardia sp. NBC_00511]|uniref:AfsR/SARP family transcriptional regulator n=1 Tax=Nocardia sp. NBC_00511 TaxID=2903591 RepID=UPI0030E40D8C